MPFEEAWQVRQMQTSVGPLSVLYFKGTPEPAFPYLPDPPIAINVNSPCSCLWAGTQFVSTDVGTSTITLRESDEYALVKSGNYNQYRIVHVESGTYISDWYAPTTYNNRWNGIPAIFENSDTGVLNYVQLIFPGIVTAYGILWGEGTIETDSNRTNGDPARPNVPAFLQFRPFAVYSSTSGANLFKTSYDSQEQQAMYEGFASIVEIVPDTPEDPYSPGGTSGSDPVGGGGSFTLEGDTIPSPTIPTISAVDCGFVTLFNPTWQQLNDLSAYMWSDLFSLDTLKKLFADPMDIILGLMIVPVDVPSSTSREVKVGGFSTGVTMNVADQQYIQVDCGTVEINPFYGSYLDYSPYTKVQCFLPFIGMIELNADEVVGRSIQIKYIVDIATGGCVAHIYISTPSGTRAALSTINGPAYSFAGQCCQPVPVTGNNWNQLISSVVSVAATAIAAGVGGIGGGMLGAAVQEPTLSRGTLIGDTSMEPVDIVASFKPVSHIRETSPEQIPQEILPSVPLKTSENKGPVQVSHLASATGTVANLTSQVMGAKPSITHTGSMSCVAGLMGIKTPFLIITRPHLSLAEHYQDLRGYPTNAYIEFSQLHGYTEVEFCRLSNMSCTTSELAEIYDLLKSGVVF